MKWYYVVTSAAYILLFFLLYTFYRSPSEPNRCDMTVMYRNMYFMTIDVDVSSSKKGWKSGDPSLQYSFSTAFEHYSTVLYGEGQYAIDFSKTGRVSGIPVIFVPGNAGSARQARSLGSLLLNKTEMRNSPFRFNVFGVDFNEELSGIAGMYLERQTRYLRHVVDHVWKMYTPRPKGLILVGHSMGGIVVRSLLRSADFDVSRIALILTLGTPHRSPPVVFDSFLDDVYQGMHKSWLSRGGKVPMISISGGLKDTLVPEHLSTEPGLYHYSTTAIDGVEAEADHLCIVWCNQLVRHTSRLLFEYAEASDIFHENFNRIVHRLYASNGNSYTKPVEMEERASGVSIHKELTVIKNEKNVSRKASMVADRNDGIFISFSKGPSWIFVDDAPFSVHSLKRSQYAYLPSSEVLKGVAVVLSPGHVVKAVAIPEESVQEQTLKVGINSLIEGLGFSLWQTTISGKQLATIVPLDIDYAWLAVKAELRQLACKNKKRGNSRIEFTSRGMRRLSHDFGNSEVAVGYKLHSNETESQFLFILDTQCSYKAMITFDYVNTITLMLQRHAYILAFCFVVYTMSALCVSATFYDDDAAFHHWAFSSDYSRSIFYALTGIIYAIIIAMNKRTDWLFISISVGVWSFVFYVFSKITIIVASMFSYFFKPGTVATSFSSAAYFLLIIGLYVSYIFNGFFALVPFLIISLIDSCRRNVSRGKLEEWSPISIIVLLNILTLLLFLPFGICSVWNLSRYGAANVYEDPTRIPAYILGLILLRRNSSMEFSFPSLKYIVVLPLAAFVLVNTESFICISRLGTFMVAAVGIFPIILFAKIPSQEPVEKSKLT